MIVLYIYFYWSLQIKYNSTFIVSPNGPLFVYLFFFFGGGRVLKTRIFEGENSQI